MQIGTIKHNMFQLDHTCFRRGGASQILVGKWNKKKERNNRASAVTTRCLCVQCPMHTQW